MVPLFLRHFPPNKPQLSPRTNPNIHTAPPLSLLINNAAETTGRMRHTPLGGESVVCAATPRSGTHTRPPGEIAHKNGKKIAIISKGHTHPKILYQTFPVQIDPGFLPL